DTAGLREVVDEIESEGVRRARAAREQSDVVLLVLDASRRMEAEERQAVAEARPERTLVVVNKSDLAAAEAAPPIAGALWVSARTGEGCDRLKAALSAVLVGTGTLEDPILTDVRHARALEGTLE